MTAANNTITAAKNTITAARNTITATNNQNTAAKIQLQQQLYSTEASPQRGGAFQ